jgi:hypothetical protein
VVAARLAGREGLVEVVAPVHDHRGDARVARDVRATSRDAHDPAKERRTRARQRARHPTAVAEAHREDRVLVDAEVALDVTYELVYERDIAAISCQRPPFADAVGVDEDGPRPLRSRSRSARILEPSEKDP